MFNNYKLCYKKTIFFYFLLLDSLLKAWVKPNLTYEKSKLAWVFEIRKNPYFSDEDYLD